MLSIIASILGLIPGLTGLASTIATKAFDSKVKMFQAKTGADRDAAVAAIKATETEAHEGNVRLSTIAGSRALLVLVFIFALPLGAYWWKIIIYDIIWCAGQCSTDPLKGNVSDWANTIIKCLFGGTTAVTVASMFFNRKNQ